MNKFLEIMKFRIRTYRCDPDKNVFCDKRNCYRRYKDCCRRTTNRKYKMNIFKRIKEKWEELDEKKKD